MDAGSPGINFQTRMALKEMYMINFLSQKPNSRASINASRRRVHVTLALVLGLISAQSAYASAVVKKGELVAVERVYQLLDKDLVTVTFDAGSGELSKESLGKLSDFV
jgi:hypothetical protein